MAAARYNPETASLRAQRWLTKRRKFYYDEREYLEKVGGEFTGAAKVMTGGAAIEENRCEFDKYLVSSSRGKKGRLREWVLPRKIKRRP